MTDRLHVVVLNYQGAQDTLRCVESLSGTSLGGIVVVDNGSAADDVAALERGLVSRESVTFVASPVNRGFGGGMNVGIIEAIARGADRVLILNNDTVVEPGAVEALSAALDRDPGLGLVVPLVTSGGSGDRVWAAGGDLDPRSLRVSHRHAGVSPADVDPVGAAVPITFAPGAAVLLRAECLAEVGGFVESFFLYFEDAELSLRVAEAGWGMALVPQARVWHRVHGGDAGRSTASITYRVRNALWVARTRFSGLPLARAAAGVSVGGLRVAVQKWRAAPSFAQGVRVLRALATGIRQGFGNLPEGGLVPTPIDPSQR